jgi:fermentation-respiration switch protein FrsA (DUF1100 family)
MESLASRIRKMVGTVLITALGFYGAFVLLVYFSQSSMLYLPDVAGRDLVADPSAIGLTFEDVHFAAADDVQLHGWLVHAASPRGTLLFFHGNAGNISHRMDSIRDFTGLGLDVFIFDYRGYGRSEGRPSERGTYRDADAAWRWLTDVRGLDSERIVLFGRSLGGAVAADLAARVRARGLILESTFTSVPDRGSELYPFLPVRLLSRFHYDTLSKMGRLDMPVLVVHSPGDEIIPFQHGVKLFEAAREPKEFLEIQGSHNDGYSTSRDSYTQGLGRFLGSIGI